MNHIKQRDISMVAVLSIITLGFYIFWLLAGWANEINHLTKKEKHNSTLIVALGIITCTFTLIIWEIIFAFDLVDITDNKNIPERNPSLNTHVLILNIAAFILASITGGLGLIISMGLGVWATCLVQKEMNLIAQYEDAT